MEAKMIQKYNKKSMTDLKKLATKHFNKFIRLRDSKNGYFKCISCKEIKSIKQMDAGHFYSAGHYQNLRYNELNVHGQCKRCNYFLHGNLSNYRIGIEKKIGLQNLSKLDEVSKSKTKLSRIYLIEIIEKYKFKTKNYESKQ